MNREKAPDSGGVEARPIPSFMTIESLPAGLDFPVDSPTLKEVEKKLSYRTTQWTRLEELSYQYEEAAANLMQDWQPMRLKPGVIGAYIAKANLFGHFGYKHYQEDALLGARFYADEMNFDRIVQVIDQSLEELKEE